METGGRLYRHVARYEPPPNQALRVLIWTTEFGRTPFAQGGDGRDHNGGSFVTWLAAAGIKAGVRLTATTFMPLCYIFWALITNDSFTARTELIAVLPMYMATSSRKYCPKGVERRV